MGDAGGERGSNIQYPPPWVKLESGGTAPEISIPLKNDSYSSSEATTAAKPLFLFTMDLCKVFSPRVSLCRSHLLPPSMGMVPEAHVQQLPNCYKESLMLIWENPVQEGSFCRSNTQAFLALGARAGHGIVNNRSPI